MPSSRTRRRIVTTAVLTLAAAAGAVSPASGDVLPTYSVSGRVLGDGGAPIEAAGVSWNVGGTYTSGAHGSTSTGADGRFSSSVQANGTPTTTTLTIDANGVTMTGARADASASLDIGDVAIPASTTSLTRLQVIDLNGDPVPSLKFAFRTLNWEGGSGCQTKTTSTGAPIEFTARCSWYGNVGPSFTDYERITDIDGGSLFWSPPVPKRISFGAEYTDAAGTKHASSGDFTISPASSGPQAWNATYRLTDLDVPPRQPDETRLLATFRNDRDGYPTTYAGTLTNLRTGQPMPMTRLLVRFRPSGATSYSTVATTTTDNVGRFSGQYGFRRAGRMVVIYQGATNLAPTQTTTWAIGGFTTTLGNSTTSTGLLARLRAPWGALGRHPIELRKRRVGSTTWVRVATYRTTTAGTVTVRVNPTRATDYRWVYRTANGFKGSMSRTVRLR